MNEYNEVIRKSAILETINRALDYSEELVELAGECIDKNDSVTADKYWYAAKVIKEFVEEILDKEDPKVSC